jgi:hypothetical protein
MSSRPSPTLVGLLFGGASDEHAVSIRSAATVLAALQSGANRERYQVRCFYIDRQGRWWPPAVAQAVFERGTPAEAAGLPADPLPSGFRGFPEGALDVEVWFPVLHGPNGEDGTIQGRIRILALAWSTLAKIAANLPQSAADDSHHNAARAQPSAEISCSFCILFRVVEASSQPPQRRQPVLPCASRARQLQTGTGQSPSCPLRSAGRCGALSPWSIFHVIPSPVWRGSGLGNLGACCA